MKIAALILVAAGPAFAQADIGFPAGMVDGCSATNGGALCVGLGTTACLSEAGPQSVGLCLGAENAYWLARIAAAEGQLRAAEAEVVAQAARLGMPAPSMDEIAAGFAAYRTAACLWRAAQEEGAQEEGMQEEGMHMGPEEIDCQMRLNAQHAFWLEARVQVR